VAIGKVKKIIVWLLLAFLVYAIFTSPDKAAGIVGNAGGVLVDGFNALLRFFDTLLGRT
jgi:hypothetical protein